MTNDFNEEAFLFYDITEKYRNSPPERLNAMAHRIYKRFLCDDSKMHVDLPDVITSYIQQEMTKTSVVVHDSTLFSAANLYVFNQMKGEWLGRFLYSGISNETPAGQKSPSFQPSNNNSPTVRKSVVVSPTAANGVDGKDEDLRYTCKVDRSLRRAFQKSIKMNDFDSALEYFERLRDSGGMTRVTGYHKGIHLLQTIADENQKKMLKSICSRDGVQIEIIENIMKNLTSSFNENFEMDPGIINPVTTSNSTGTLPWVGSSSRKAAEARVVKIGESTQRSISFCSTFVPQRSFVEKKS